MRLYNTLTRKVEQFKSLHPHEVKIYSCGPTVYNYAHIGNLGSYIYADTLRRVVALAGYDPKHVMNYTDIDDKTIRTSLEYYPEKESRAALWKFTETYIEAFLEDMKAVGNDLKAIQFTRATDYIDNMQKLITELHEQKVAYIAQDGVYFSIEAYKAKGKRYGQLLELTVDNTSSQRIQNDEYDKDSAHDFALWKLKKENEPAWDFELDGKNLSGRPGWHIECSAMSAAELGLPFDIHTGGVDLIFPHHENEIAQSTASVDNPVMAKFFVHNEHLLVDGKKMSKSLGNFYALQDITDAGFDALVFRLMILQSHYRSQVNFTWEGLEAAKQRLQGLRAVADLKWQTIDIEPWLDKSATDESIFSPLLDDLSTPSALAALNSFAKKAESNLLAKGDASSFQELLAKLDDVFGLGLSERPDISQDEKDIISQREQYRSDKDWQKSDIARTKLEERGIGLRDTDHSTIWFRL